MVERFWATVVFSFLGTGQFSGAIWFLGRVLHKQVIFSWRDIDMFFFCGKTPKTLLPFKKLNTFTQTFKTRLAYHPLWLTLLENDHISLLLFFHVWVDDFPALPVPSGCWWFSLQRDLRGSGHHRRDSLAFGLWCFFLKITSPNRNPTKKLHLGRCCSNFVLENIHK